MSRRPPARLLLVVALAVLAGCVTAAGPGPAGPATGEELRATVVDVVDGDTVEVRLADGTPDTVRLLGVDTPEVHVANEPAEFEGVPDTEAGARGLREAGHGASAFVEARLAGEPVRLVVDPLADRRGAYGRLLAYVHHDGADVNRLLVARGHARVYDATFSRSATYHDSEATAQDERRGLWRCREPGGATPTPAGDGPLRLVRVQADPAGDDRANLTGEYVVLEHAGDATLDLTGWTLSDEAGHVYRFPDGFALGPGDRVTVHTGAGEDTASSLYWDAGTPVWNNGGDVVTVRASDGTVVLRHAYG